jgi:hypothetical protein
VEGGQQALVALGDQQGGRLAALARAPGRGDPGQQLFRRHGFGVGEVGVEQGPGQRRLPDDAAVGGAHRDGGLAEGVEGAAGLAHLAGVLMWAAIRAITSAGRIGLVT